jgi:hypothetical protein
MWPQDRLTSYGYVDDEAPEESSVMVQPNRQDRQPAQRKATQSGPVGRRALSTVRDRFEGSLAQSFLIRLKALDFANQAMLFGAGLLVSLLPFVILLSAFASQRIDDDISLRLGLDRRAAGIVDHLFTSAPATLNAATATSLIFLVAGMLAVASSLQQIYEKVFRQDHRGMRDVYRLVTWIVVLCGGGGGKPGRAHRRESAREEDGADRVSGLSSQRDPGERLDGACRGDVLFPVLADQ